MTTTSIFTIAILERKLIFTIISCKATGNQFWAQRKQNMAENPFARSDRRERKSYYRRTMDFQTDFAGSGAQN